MIILGIETSCDETSASIVNDGTILSNITYTQLIHSKYGGVVPEFASREHEQILPLIVENAIKEAKISFNDITSIGVTCGPGLMGALLVGVNFVKGMAIALDIPFHDSYFVVGHVHYVLSLGAVYSLIACIYRRSCIITNYFYSELFGKVHFICLFISPNLIFMPMHFAGIAGHPRRIPD